MWKLFLVTCVFGCCLVLCLQQLYRGIRDGKVTGLAGGKGKSFFVNVDRTERPFAFWGFMVQQLIFTALVSSALWMGLFQQYVFAERKPTIASVQHDGPATLLVYWRRPDRIDDPLQYIVYRGSADNAMVEIARLPGGATDGQYVDRDVDPGTTYTYQVEARFHRLTQWLLANGATRSEPMSGKTFSR
ncbi:fibronectin type III domain-containing protein [Stieleria sp. ICT_E10.1]|uniref:fibronectin type III domain-containing protein n=1 Tax=Stieleria sedimenti TaxID=2976331 RepID=UPI0021802457|nr:fibronectin type III domain-containing protein [Stieleria sedimenti]MCS7468236.1 fibronectin type III domain-containing protein [Stieleria sedimenti]